MKAKGIITQEKPKKSYFLEGKVAVLWSSINLQNKSMYLR